MFNRFFSWAGLRYEKRGIAGDIQADIRTISRKVNSQTSRELLPYGIKIEWVDEDTKEAFVKDKQLVVRMKHHKNQARNFLNATLSYAEFGLIPHSRSLIEKNILRAIELIFSRKVFIDVKRHDVEQIFLNEIYNSEIQKIPSLQRYCNVMNGLERTGCFTRIMLQEFSHLGDKVFDIVSTKNIHDETVEYTKMLERLVKREHGEDVDLSYKGNYIKTTIVLVARPEKYLLSGIEPYLRYINRSLEREIETFYICAIGDQNIFAAKQIMDAYEGSKKLVTLSSNVYSIDNHQKAICIVLQKEKI